MSFEILEITGISNLHARFSLYVQELLRTRYVHGHERNAMFQTLVGKRKAAINLFYSIQFIQFICLFVYLFIYLFIYLFEERRGLSLSLQNVSLNSHAVISIRKAWGAQNSGIACSRNQNQEFLGSNPTDAFGWVLAPNLVTKFPVTFGKQILCSY